MQKAFAFSIYMFFSPLLCVFFPHKHLYFLSSFLSHCFRSWPFNLPLAKHLSLCLFICDYSFQYECLAEMACISFCCPSILKSLFFFIHFLPLLHLLMATALQLAPIPSPCLCFASSSFRTHLKGSWILTVPLQFSPLMCCTLSWSCGDPFLSCFGSWYKC